MVLLRAYIVDPAFHRQARPRSSQEQTTLFEEIVTVNNERKIEIVRELEQGGVEEPVFATL